MKNCLSSMRVSWLGLIVLLMLSDYSAAAMVRGVTGQLKLLATINGEPAFREVIWQLKPLNPMNKNTTNAELTITRHSAVIDLEAGKYQVNATAGTKTESQTITIEEGGKHNLVLNLR